MRMQGGVLESGRTGAVAAPPAATATSMRDLLGIRPGPGSANGPCSWLLGHLQPSLTADLDAASWTLARDIMAVRTGPSSAFTLWEQRATGGRSHSARDRRIVEPFVLPIFGSPSDPKDEQHVQGYVAESLWYGLTSEIAATETTGRRLVHLEPPGFMVSEPGGDGLAVYEVTGGSLVFRLWEVKKHVSVGHLSRTIGRACDQLVYNAEAYLAKLVSTAASKPAPLSKTYAELVELWVDGDPRSGVGVSIATSSAHAPKRTSFGTLATKFPHFSRTQREGLILAIGDFADFADRVRGHVWSGL